MLNPTGLYDRVLRRLSRRDLMKAAWMLGASAVALPVEARRQSGVYTRQIMTCPLNLYCVLAVTWANTTILFSIGRTPVLRSVPFSPGLAISG